MYYFNFSRDARNAMEKTATVDHTQHSASAIAFGLKD